MTILQNKECNVIEKEKIVNHVILFSEQRCFDDNVAFSGGTQSCAEFVAEDNCRCAITEGDMMINTTCCQSCKKVCKCSQLFTGRGALLQSMRTPPHLLIPQNTLLHNPFEFSITSMYWCLPKPQLLYYYLILLPVPATDYTLPPSTLFRLCFFVCGDFWPWVGYRSN